MDARLARKIAEPLGIGPPDARAAAGQAGFREPRGKAPIDAAPSLSMESNPSGIQTRKVAIVLGAGAGETRGDAHRGPAVQRRGPRGRVGDLHQLDVRRRMQRAIAPRSELGAASSSGEEAETWLSEAGSG